jgi:hypothetical protein
MLCRLPAVAPENPALENPPPENPAKANSATEEIRLAENSPYPLPAATGADVNSSLSEEQGHPLPDDEAVDGAVEETASEGIRPLAYYESTEPSAAPSEAPVARRLPTRVHP